MRGLIFSFLLILTLSTTHANMDQPTYFPQGTSNDTADFGREQTSGSWTWKTEMMKALNDNNSQGNIMINRNGQLWWDRTVPPNAQEYDITIQGDSFHVCTFSGAARFQTTGWYGWQNWGFQGNFNRVDKFTVVFS